MAPLPPRWNCLDGRGFDEGKTALLHYTDIITQIWRPYPERLSYRRHPVAAAEDIWVNLYREAQDKGYIPPSPPPEGTLPSGVDDSFLSFLDEQLSNLVLRQLNQAAA